MIKRSRVPTGIPGLDELISGGFAENTDRKSVV